MLGRYLSPRLYVSYGISLTEQLNTLKLRYSLGDHWVVRTEFGQARGAALCAVPRGLPVFEYAPRAIKLALVGSGAAEKTQVTHMISILLKLQGRIGPDASDALAVAVCHAHSRRAHMLAQSAARA